MTVPHRQIHWTRSLKPEGLTFAETNCDPCNGCGASRTSCETVRWLSPRRCCGSCTHEPETPKET